MRRGWVSSTSIYATTVLVLGVSQDNRDDPIARLSPTMVEWAVETGAVGMTNDLVGVEEGSSLIGGWKNVRSCQGHTPIECPGLRRLL